MTPGVSESQLNILIIGAATINLYRVRKCP